MGFFSNWFGNRREKKLQQLANVMYSLFEGESQEIQRLKTLVLALRQSKNPQERATLFNQLQNQLGRFDNEEKTLVSLTKQMKKIILKNLQQPLS